MNLIHHPHRRHLKDHWPDAGASWRALANFDAVESRFAAEWRTEAFRIWRATRSVKGTLAQAWLESHGIHLVLPPTLRFHPRLEHFAGRAWPALCALITDVRSGLPLGIHAIYLASDGSSLAPVPSPMVTLGVCDGGVVRLGEPSDVLTVGVGLLGCLMVAQVGAGAAWVTLTSSGLAGLDLPADVRDVILLAGDSPDAAQAAAWRLKWQGRRVVIVAPLREIESCGCPCPAA
jgi:putative DNA primase/helicase